MEVSSARAVSKTARETTASIARRANGSQVAVRDSDLKRKQLKSSFFGSRQPSGARGRQKRVGNIGVLAWMLGPIRYPTLGPPKEMITNIRTQLSASSNGPS